jgi:hypothetical protein
VLNGFSFDGAVGCLFFAMVIPFCIQDDTAAARRKQRRCI